MAEITQEKTSDTVSGSVETTQTQATTQEKQPQFSPEEYESLKKQLEEAQSLIGRHSNELGDLRKLKDELLNQNQFLRNTLAKLSAQQQTATAAGQPADTNQDYNAVIKELTAAVESGDISTGEALQKIYQITQDVATTKAVQLALQKFNEELQNREINMAAQQFIKEHPDYIHLTPDIMSKLRENPLENEIALYYKYQMEQLRQQMEKAIQEAKELGKQEAERLFKGGAAADKTLKEPGSSIRDFRPTEKPKTANELEAAMLNAMLGAFKEG